MAQHKTECSYSYMNCTRKVWLFCYRVPLSGQVTIDVLCNPRLYICTDESIIKCEVDSDVELFSETLQNDKTLAQVFHSCVKYLYKVQQTTPYTKSVVMI